MLVSSSGVTRSPGPSGRILKPTILFRLGPRVKIPCFSSLGVRAPRSQPPHSRSRGCDRSDNLPRPPSRLKDRPPTGANFPAVASAFLFLHSCMCASCLEWLFFGVLCDMLPTVQMKCSSEMAERSLRRECHGLSCRIFCCLAVRWNCHHLGKILNDLVSWMKPNVQGLWCASGLRTRTEAVRARR